MMKRDCIFIHPCHNVPECRFSCGDYLPSCVEDDYDCPYYLSSQLTSSEVKFIHKLREEGGKNEEEQH